MIQSRLMLYLMLPITYITPAFAQVNNSGVFDDVLSRYASAAAGWESTITTAASNLFWTLALISMVWTFGMMALRKADIGEFFAEFIRFTIFTGFFWWLLSNGPSFANSIIQSLRQIGSDASNMSDSLSPSDIVDIGFEIWVKVLDQSSLWSPADSIAGIIIAGIILLILAAVAVNMLLLLVTGWLLAYAGIFFLGFGGSRWTSDMAINYFKTVLGLAAQLMTMILLIGIGKAFLDDYYMRMSQGISLKEMAVLLVVSFILLILSNKLPSVVSGIVTGSGIGSIGSFGGGSIVAGAAGVVAGATIAGTAMKTMGSNMAGAGSAIGAAFNATRGLSDGIPGGGSSDDGSGMEPFRRHMGMASTVGGTTKNLLKGVASVAGSKISANISDSAAGRVAAAIKAQHSPAAYGDGPSPFLKGGNSISAGGKSSVKKA